MTKQWANTSTCKHSNVVKGVCRDCGIILDPNRYPVFSGSTPEESECDDNLDEIADIEGDDL